MEVVPFHSKLLTSILYPTAWVAPFFRFAPRWVRNPSDCQIISISPFDGNRLECFLSFFQVIKYKTRPGILCSAWDLLTASPKFSQTCNCLYLLFPHNTTRWRTSHVWPLRPANHISANAFKTSILIRVDVKFKK